MQSSDQQCVPFDIQQRVIESCWENLIDELVIDACQEVHRHAKSRGSTWGHAKSKMSHGDNDQPEMGLKLGDPLEEPLKSFSTVIAKGTGSASGSVDIFGQSHPAKAIDIVTCKNCGR